MPKKDTVMVFTPKQLEWLILCVTRVKDLKSFITVEGRLNKKNEHTHFELYGIKMPIRDHDKLLNHLRGVTYKPIKHPIPKLKIGKLIRVKGYGWGEYYDATVMGTPKKAKDVPESVTRNGLVLLVKFPGAKGEFWIDWNEITGQWEVQDGFYSNWEPE